MKEETRSQAQQLCTFLTDHKGLEVTMIDVSQDCSWTDCFIICTVTSLGHLRGQFKSGALQSLHYSLSRNTDKDLLIGS